MSERNLILLEDGWNAIKTQAVDRIIEILNTDLEKNFNRAEYMAIYTIVYNMCNQKPPYNYSAQMYERYAITFRDYLTSIVSSKLHTAQDTAFLPEVDKHWRKNLIMLNWMKHFFQYIDRFYVINNKVPNLTETSMKIFYTTILEPFRDRVVDEFIRFLYRDREGEDINRPMLKNISNMFIQMGRIHNSESIDEIYVSILEARVLETTAVYYQAKSAGWILEDSGLEFLLKAEKTLNEEITRVEHVLIGSSKEKVIKVYMKEVILGNQTKFLEKTGIYNMFINDKIEELSRLYRLCVKVGSPPIATAFTNYFTSQGEIIISDKKLSISAEKKEGSNDPVFINALISLIERFKWIISSSFNNNVIFHRVLKEGMEKIMNEHVGKYSISEILANYCDKLLKKTSKRITNDELEDKIAKSIELFEHLTEKDLFVHIYSNQLAKRLLNDQSSSEDAEKSVISKLKMCCGVQFTSRMERMLTDLHIAEDTFKKFEAAGLSMPIEFKAQVLTSGNWPTHKFHNVALPYEFTQCITTFESYYRESTRHSKLKWIYSLGTAVLTGSFQGKKYDFFCSTYQACVLYLFNQSLELTFEDIRSAMNFDEETCKKVLMPLFYCKNRIIDKQSEGKVIRSNDIFTIRKNFSIQMKKVKILQPNIEETYIKEKVQSDRNLAIEAAVVRIMKSRKKLSHNDLVKEVLIIMSLFKPQVKYIKQRVENLISRDFLARDSEDPNIYLYLA